ncbi:MAG: hypothetical protein E6J91_30205 [Deltaproteobacteria bacterium]|nr:MAG: hypothetical protein E6J91_30205 [Deltaproteobacteria bacterium]
MVRGGRLLASEPEAIEVGRGLAPTHIAQASQATRRTQLTSRHLLPARIGSRRASPRRAGRRPGAFPSRDDRSITQENLHMLIAYQVALDLVRALRPVVARLHSYSAEAAEGDRRHGRDPRRFWDIAHGSAGEIRGALDLADAWAGRSRAGQRVPCSIASWAFCGGSPAVLAMLRVPPAQLRDRRSASLGRK